MYIDDLAYDEETPPSLSRMLGTNTTWLGTRPKLDQSPTNNDVQGHMATNVIPPGSVAKPSPCIPGINPLCALCASFLVFCE